MNDSIFLINPNLPIRNGIAVVQPQPGQVALGIATSGGFLYQDSDPMRAQLFQDASDYGNAVGQRYRPEKPLNVQHTGADVAHGAPNADCVLDYAAAGPGRQHVIGTMEYAYYTTPTSGTIRIEDGSGVVVWGPFPVGDNQTHQLRFDEEPKRFSQNTDLRIILGAAGAGVSGVVSATHWTI